MAQPARTGDDIAALVLAGVGVIFMLAALIYGQGIGIIGGLGIGLLMLVAGVNASKKASSKICPFCKERVQKQAIKCKHCSSELAAS